MQLNAYVFDPAGRFLGSGDVDERGGFKTGLRLAQPVTGRRYRFDKPGSGCSSTRGMLHRWPPCPTCGGFEARWREFC